MTSLQAPITLERPETVKPVAATVFGFIWLAIFGCFAHAAPPNASLPPIEAKTYGVSVARKSRSGRVLLFSVPRESMPTPGKVIQLRTNNATAPSATPAAAIQVLKVYSDKDQFAAKIVRRYSQQPEITTGNQLTAVEKISDFVPAPPAPTPQDRADLQELEKIEPPPGPISSIPAPLAPPPSAPPPPAVPATPPPTPLLNPVNPPPSAPPTANANEVDTLLSQMEGGAASPPPPTSAPVAAQPAMEPPPQESPAPLAVADGTAPPPPPETESVPDLEPPPPTEVARENEEEKKQGSEEPTLEEEDDMSSLTVTEVPAYDKFTNWFTAGFGFFSGLDQNAASAYYVGTGFRFAKTVSKMQWEAKAPYQGTWALEGGIYYYKVFNFVVSDQGETQGDSYSILPVIATVRHNLRFTENFGLFAYAGLIYNYVYVHSSGRLTETQLSGALDLLRGGFGSSGIGLAAGIGLNFMIGPNWETRIDLGLDVVGLGLMLRF